MYLQIITMSRRYNNMYVSYCMYYKHKHYRNIYFKQNVNNLKFPYHILNWRS